MAVNNIERSCVDFRLAASIVADMCNPATKGAKSLGYIANFDDIDHTAMASSRVGNLYNTFALKEGAKLYKIFQSGKKPFNGAKSDAVVNDYRTTWNKTIPFVIFDNGADVTENIIDQLANGKFVSVVENAFSGHNGDNTYEIVGMETGLMMSEGTAEKYNDDYGGGWYITMMEENAPSAGLYVLDEDVAKTKAMLETLCTATS